jgi:hypothetical protein
VNIALTSESDLVSDSELAFIAAACNAQAEEFCRAHGLPFVSVSFYARGTKLPSSTTYALVIRDQIDAPGAAGFHDVDGNGVPYGELLAQDPTSTGVTASHEIQELILDPPCDFWAPWSSGRRQAKEACDRVEADTYVQRVTVLGETRDVPVSNYLLPPAFVEGSAGPWDRMGLLKSWDEIRPGGYCIVMNARGDVSNVFGDSRTVPQSFARKLTNPSSRTLRRLRNPPRPSMTSPESAGS